MPSNSEPNSPLSKWLDRGILFCVVLIALFSPHSIAISQGAWLLGMVLWLARLAVYPQPRLYRTPLDYALLAFFILSGVSAVFSYAPIVSIGKMRAASLFTVVYLVAENVRSSRVVRLLALALIVSCMANVFVSAGRLAVGKGVKVDGVSSESPLAKAVYRTRTITQPAPIVNGDIVWEVDGQKIANPDELAAALAARSNSQTAQVRIYRVEWTPTLEVPLGRLLAGSTGSEQLGISGWTRGRDWRAIGFFDHWTTYAEVLQLIASLALGLFLALPGKRSGAGLLLLLCLGGLLFALGLTVTRASWVGFTVSAALMLLLSVSRRTVVLVGLCAIPLILAGLFFLQHRRNVGLIDANDQSTTWRETVWREGFDLLVSNPRHLVVGIGMDSIKSRWREWGLFDYGRLPPGHMHSDPLQIALERGVPSLIAWLLLLGLYARILWRLIFAKRVSWETKVASVSEGITVSFGSWLDRNTWIDRGIALGALGGLAGFFTSGLVHYNWGDSEVIMVFYFIMGLAITIQNSER
jgi:O-antigen ligase